MSPSLVWHFADEKATFARGWVLGHTGLSLYKSSFDWAGRRLILYMYCLGVWSGRAGWNISVPYCPEAIGRLEGLFHNVLSFCYDP